MRSLRCFFYIKQTAVSLSRLAQKSLRSLRFWPTVNRLRARSAREEKQERQEEQGEQEKQEKQEKQEFLSLLSLLSLLFFLFSPLVHGYLF